LTRLTQLTLNAIHAILVGQSESVFFTKKAAARAAFQYVPRSRPQADSPGSLLQTATAYSGLRGRSGFGDGLGCGLMTGGLSFLGGFRSSLCANEAIENAASMAKLINVNRKILISTELPFLTYSRLAGKAGKDVRGIKKQSRCHGRTYDAVPL
jgi:hypothetical protein